jgi:hypothetical protein
VTDEAPREGKPRKSLLIDLGLRPEASTSLGTIYIKDDGWRRAGEYAKQAPDDVSSQVRSYLAPTLRTNKGPDEDSSAPSPEQIAALNAEDLERLATSYLDTMNAAHFINVARSDQPSVVRSDGESSVNFLDRLLRWQAEYQKRQAEEFVENARGTNKYLRDLDAAVKGPMGQFLEEEAKRRKKLEAVFGNDAFRSMAKLHEQASGVSRLIEETRRQESALEKLRGTGILDDASTRISQFERPYIPPPMPSLRDTLRDHTEELNEAADRREEQRRAEHAEELEVNRSIREVSLRSSEMLGQLIQTAALMLERFGVFLADFKASSDRADEGVRRSLVLARRSLIFTALLAAFALAVSTASFLQDRADIESDDRWQADTLEVLKAQAAATEKARAELSSENAKLRERVEALEKAAAGRQSPIEKNRKPQP